MIRSLPILSFLLVAISCGREPAPGEQGWPDQPPCGAPELAPTTATKLPPVHTLNLTASITVVQDSLDGLETDVAVGLAGDGTVHAAYWRCSWHCPNCSVLESPDLPCPGLHAARRVSGKIQHELVDEESGRGVSLLVGKQSLEGIAAASAPHPGAISVHRPAGKGTIWVSDQVGSPTFPLGPTWSSVTGGAHRVAWTDSMLIPTLEVARRNGSTWAHESTLTLPEKAVTHTACFDVGGKLHAAWTEGEPPTLSSPAAAAEVRYRAPGVKTVPVPLTDDPGALPRATVDQLVIDAAGRPHLLVSLYDDASQSAAPRLFHVVNPGGGWISTELTKLLPYPVLLDDAALAVDGAGAAYAALSVQLSPNMKGEVTEHALLVGTNAHGSWLIHELGDRDVTGAVDLAAAGGGTFHLGYFGAHTFKIAEVAIYR